MKGYWKTEFKRAKDVKQDPSCEPGPDRLERIFVIADEESKSQRGKMIPSLWVNTE